MGKPILVFNVKSKSTPGLEHIVRKMYDGRWYCSCKWNVLRNKECSHIRQMKAKLTQSDS